MQNGSSWIVKALFALASSIIITLVGYLHVSTVANISTYIEATREQTITIVKALESRVNANENRISAIDMEQNKRTARLDVLERDMRAIETQTQTSLARIEKTLDGLSVKVDDLRMAKTKG